MTTLEVVSIEMCAGLRRLCAQRLADIPPGEAGAILARVDRYDRAAIEAEIAEASDKSGTARKLACAKAGIEIEAVASRHFTVLPELYDRVAEDPLNEAGRSARRNVLLLAAAILLMMMVRIMPRAISGVQFDQAGAPLLMYWAVAILLVHELVMVFIARRSGKRAHSAVLSEASALLEQMSRRLARIDSLCLALGDTEVEARSWLVRSRAGLDRASAVIESARHVVYLQLIAPLVVGGIALAMVLVRIAAESAYLLVHLRTVVCG